jgi:hypothetical protein
MLVRPRPLALVFVAALGIVGVACGTSTKTAASSPTTSHAAMETHTMGSESSFLLKAEAQHGDGRTVQIEDVVLTGTSGWVAVHEQAAGGMGGLIGESTLISPGPHMGISVELMHPLTASTTVIAVLHREDNNNTTFDFPNGDAVVQVGGQDVEVPIKIDVS